MMRMRTPLRAQLTVRFAACLGGAALMLAGCAPHKRALDAGALPATSGAAPTSWMARGAAKSDLLYVTDGGEDSTYVFDYPGGPSARRQRTRVGLRRRSGLGDAGGDQRERGRRHLALRARQGRRNKLQRWLAHCNVLLRLRRIGKSLRRRPQPILRLCA